MITERLGDSPRTVLDALEKRADEMSDRVAYRFLREGELEQDSITFGDLRLRARAAAARLTAVKRTRTEAAVLLYPQGIDFIVAFFACMYAGVMAVPASISHRKRGLDVLSRIAADSGARWILSTGALLEQLSVDIAEVPGLSGLPCIDLEQGSQRLALSEPSWDADAIALLQYTSGSTGMPSGVALTHANLADNQRQMQHCFEHDDQTVFVSWLPMFHDMGLGTVLMSVWSGRPCVIMTPSVFVQKPRRWLMAISQYRGTTSLAPDFAYDLCVRRIDPEEREGLDLSSWRVAVNGSEPVRSSTIERFVEAFGPCGFRREAFTPAYGLAEATLFVCATRAQKSPVIERFSRYELERGEGVLAPEPGAGPTLVGCGSPRLGTRLVIVDPETREECPPRKIGEIWIQNDSVGAGYWNKEAETQYTFRARTADGRGPFLRTGDLAFEFDHQLFVAGRHKDLVIIHGRNHSPQDIEDSVSTCHPALVPRGCAAFSIDSEEGEQLVIVQEVARTALRTLDVASVYRSIRSVVSADHALMTYAIVLLKPASLPRTTSGKVRRKTCRQGFLDNSLPAVASWRAAPQLDAAQSQRMEDRAAGSRAERVIQWLRHNAVALAEAYAKADRRELSSALSGLLSKQGIIAMMVETRQGGLGLGHLDCARVLEQLAAVDFSLSLLIGANNYLGVQPIAKHASEQHKALLLSRLAHGKEFAAFAFDDPDDSQPRDARPRLAGEDPWRLSGSRDFYGASLNPSLVSVVARHDEPPGGSAFVVASGADGVRLTFQDVDRGRPIGLSRSRIEFEGVPLGRQNLLGSFGSGGDVAREAMLQVRLAVAAACIGAMKRCAQLAGAEYPARAFNGAATPNPVVLTRLSSAAARVTALECLVHTIARALDTGQAVPAEGFAACKLLGPEMLLRSIDDLMLVAVKMRLDESDQVLRIYKEAGALRNFDGSPEALAESTGAAVMAEDAPLRLLLEDVFAAPAVVSWVQPVLDAVRHRMQNLKGTLARRAERWGHTRAGELTTWLSLLAAVEGCRAAAPAPALEHAHAWTLAQLEHAVSAVRMGTPSETATLDADDIAATFAAYARTIGNLSKQEAVSPHAHTTGRGHDGTASGDRDAARRELRSRIISWLAHRLRIPVSEVEPGRSFSDHGLDSVSSVELVKSLSDHLDRDLDATVVWSFATIDALADYLSDLPAAAPPVVVSTAADPRSSPSPGPTSAVTGRLEDALAKLELELRSRS